MKPDNWPNRRLNEICESIDYGYTASARSEPVGPKFLRITDVVPSHLQWSDVPHCAIEKEKERKFSLRDGDIVIARTGATTGYAKLLKHPPKSVFASYLVRIRVQPQVALPGYVGPILESAHYKQFIMSQIGGAAQPNANAKVLTSYSIALPPLSVQHQIASILSAYDDLIENNTRRIAILEEMARALYQEWFVHFRFPGHEHVPLAPSPLGPIPEGWVVGELQDAVVLQRGFDLPIKEREAGGIPVFASTGVIGAHSEAKVRGPGVVTGRSGSLGTVMYCPKDYWPLNTTLWVKEFRRSTPLHAFYLLQSIGLEKYNGGAAVPTLNRNHVHRLPTILPSPSVLGQFDEVVSPIYEMKFLLALKNENLRTTRNLLLPKLISGEIDVSTLREGPIAEAAD